MDQWGHCIAELPWVTAAVAPHQEQALKADRHRCSAGTELHQLHLQAVVYAHVGRLTVMGWFVYNTARRGALSW